MMVPVILLILNQRILTVTSREVTSLYRHGHHVHPKRPILRRIHGYAPVICHAYHACRPDYFPCRDEKFNKVLTCVGELLEELWKVVEVALYVLPLYILQRDRLDHTSSDIWGVPASEKTAWFFYLH